MNLSVDLQSRTEEAGETFTMKTFTKSSYQEINTR